jgi:hypothetical protein
LDLNGASTHATSLPQADAQRMPEHDLHIGASHLADCLSKGHRPHFGAKPGSGVQRVHTPSVQQKEQHQQHAAVKDQQRQR